MFANSPNIAPYERALALYLSIRRSSASRLGFHIPSQNFGSSVRLEQKWSRQRKPYGPLFASQSSIIDLPFFISFVSVHFSQFLCFFFFLLSCRRRLMRASTTGSLWWWRAANTPSATRPCSKPSATPKVILFVLRKVIQIECLVWVFLPFSLNI